MPTNTSNPFIGVPKPEVTQWLASIKKLLEDAGFSAQDFATADGGAGGMDPASQQAALRKLIGDPTGSSNVNPLGPSAMMQSSLPSGGPVQWLGGMPPGYNDDVAKKLATTAIAGNVLSGDNPIMGGLSALFKGLFGQKGQ